MGGRPGCRRPILEVEGQLRVMLAPLCADLAARLKDICTDIAGTLENTTRIRRKYHRSRVHDCLSSFAVLVDDWAERSQNRLDAWAHQPADEREHAALAVFERLPYPDLRRRSDHDFGF